MDAHPALLLIALAAFVCYAVSGLVLLVVRQQCSPLRRLRGPHNPSFFLGNLLAMHDQENTNLVASWEAEHGSTFVYHGFIGGCRLMTTDPRAVAHILGNAYDYPKPDFVRDSLATMVAGHDGLLTCEGAQHKRQRKIIAPAFSATNIRAITPIFWDKASELRDIWLRIADDPQVEEDTKGAAVEGGVGEEEQARRTDFGPRVDVLAWLGRATLDIIGLAGFGYAFNALTDETNELALAFAAVFSTARRFRVMTILQVWFPVLRVLRRNRGMMAHMQATIRRIGLALIEERRAAVLAEAVGQQSKDEVGRLELGRDLLSVLIRANMAHSARAQMNVEETLCQISTFIAAGHETTASALTWCLYALAAHPAAQDALRAELRALPPDGSDGHDGALLRAPYLDAVVRETLRLHAPITNTMRVCARARDAIPVAASFVDRAGVRRSVIEVRQHDIISVPIQAVNKSTAVWGPDAHLFRPERWANLPDATQAVPGLWSNTLTFLNGNPLNGNRACIGYKFALTEIKVFLCVLLRDIEFALDPGLIIEKKINVVTRPFVKSEPALGNQMPLRVRRVAPDWAPAATAVATDS